MKEHEKRCKVTVGQGISFPPKRKIGCSSHLTNVGKQALKTLEEYYRFSMLSYINR